MQVRRAGRSHGARVRASNREARARKQDRHQEKGGGCKRSSRMMIKGERTWKETPSAMDNGTKKQQVEAKVEETER